MQFATYLLKKIQAPLMLKKCYDYFEFRRIIPIFVTTKPNLTKYLKKQSLLLGTAFLFSCSFCFHNNTFLYKVKTLVKILKQHLASLKASISSISLSLLVLK
jgi:hypothetical protein